VRLLKGVNSHITSISPNEDQKRIEEAGLIEGLNQEHQNNLKNLNWQAHLTLNIERKSYP
jgi:hypothetical protein